MCFDALGARAERWKVEILMKGKDSTQGSSRSHLRKYILAYLGKLRGANEHGPLASPIVIHPLDIAPDSFTASPRFSLILTLAHPPLNHLQGRTTLRSTICR